MCEDAEERDGIIERIEEEGGITKPMGIPFDSYQFQEHYDNEEMEQLRQDERFLIERRKAYPEIRQSYMMPKDFKLEPADKFDFVQCEAGNSHTMLLNRLGQVFTFGEGLNG